MEIQNDPLWNQARKRVSFKRNLVIYIIMNAFFWAIWYFATPGGYMWPVWAMLGWGIGLVFNYMDAYHLNKEDMIRKEYEKLKNKSE
jgi:hypothetical protein